MELIFEWDASKAQANLKKHRVSFEEAKTVFNDPLLLTYPDEIHSETEERLIRNEDFIKHSTCKGFAQASYRSYLILVP